MARSGPDLPERVEFGWTWVPEQLVPGVGPDAHHGGKSGFEVAKFHRPNCTREVGTKRSHGRLIVGPRVYGHDQENRRAGERCRYGLCNNHGVNLREVFRMAFRGRGPTAPFDFASKLNDSNPIPTLECATWIASVKQSLRKAPGEPSRG